MRQIKIETGIEPPSKSGPLYPFDSMEVDQSFEVDKSEHNRLYMAAFKWKKTHEGWNYAARTLGNKIRLWRIACVALALSASPAFAWTNTNNGHNNQIVDGGPGAQSNAASKATSAAAAAAKARVDSHNQATGGQSNVTVTTLGNNGSSGGGSRAPDVTLPSFGGGGMDCPTVGFGAGGSGLGGGGGFGPSWISSKCDKRRTADLLAHLYGVDVAQAYAEANIDGVKEAVAASHHAEHKHEYPEWCYTRDVGNVAQREICEGKR